MLQIFPRSNNIFTFTYLQRNYWSLSHTPKKWTSSHASSRKHQTTARLTGHSRIVGPQCVICFVIPFWSPEVVCRFLENFMDASYTYIVTGTTTHFEPRPSLEVFTSCLYSVQHSSSFSPSTSWHHPSSHFGQSGHCFFRFLNNVVFRSRLSALRPTPYNLGGPTGLLLSLGLHHGPVLHGRPYQ